MRDPPFYVEQRGNKWHVVGPQGSISKHGPRVLAEAMCRRLNWAHARGFVLGQCSVRGNAETLRALTSKKGVEP